MESAGWKLQLADVGGPSVDTEMGGALSGHQPLTKARGDSKV